MNTPSKQEYSLKELEAKYNDITALYDYAEELVATVESDAVTDPGTQLDIVEPLIAEIGDATDVLSEQFILIAEGSKSGASGKASKKRVEKALRKIYVAIQDYQERVRITCKETGANVANIADTIVEKIQHHLERVIGIFLEFVDLSLLNLMGKAEAEALRVRNTHIAMLMHRQAMSQQQ